MVKEEVKGAGRPISTPAPWGDLYKKVGGQEVLATKLGVSKSTVGKWALETHRVPELARKELLRLCKHYAIHEGMEKFQASS